MAITEQLPPLSLYVHIPWCVRKCPYCDFNSHQAGGALPEQAYTAALLEDLQQDAEHAQGRLLGSIFFGGGTPSLFSGASIGAVIEQAEKLFGFDPLIEVTLEANPGTAEQGNFHALRAAGVNRLSLGIQSFNDSHLAGLGRIHNGGEAVRAFELARTAGFDNINVDLMHGLPQQTVEQAEQDLAQAFQLAPEHVSWYQLTIEPNTVFYNRPPLLPVDDTLADIQDLGQQRLAEHGYQQYEVSAYSQPGRQARHNRNYWEFGDYLAAGAGAHGKVTRGPGDVTRYRKTRKPEDYLDASKAFTAASERVPRDHLTGEFFLNALRLTEGFPTQLFQQRTGLALDTVQRRLSALEQDGLLMAEPEWIKPTELGQRFLNDLLRRLVD